MLAIRNYLDSRGEQARNICLIPSSAHGTNAASAVMAGMKVIVIACDDDGNPLVDVRTGAGHADVRLGGLWNRHVWKKDTRARAGLFTAWGMSN